jgi:hypothetical protein
MQDSTVLTVLAVTADPVLPLLGPSIVMHAKPWPF